MRNDSLDELDDLPSLTPDDRAERAPAGSRRDAPDDSPVRVTVAARGDRPARGNAALWLLVGGLLLALVALGWWSRQQIARMEQQLVATQESFARISEDAAGRLKDISGKVVATESSVTSENEALKLRIKQLENRLAELGRQQQGAVERQASQLEQLRGELKTQQASASQLLAALKEQQAGVAGLEGRVRDLTGEQVALKVAQGELGKLDGRLQALAGEVDTLQQQGDPHPAIRRLEADLLVLRSQLDNRPAGASTAELDAFRAQVTRNITTLQAQVRNLQQQLNAR
jgi:DNA repair exonuclease SbcCD ATPase subunit